MANHPMGKMGTASASVLMWVSTGLLFWCVAFHVGMVLEEVVLFTRHIVQDVLQGGLEGREFEREACLLDAGGDDPAAFEDEFCFCADDFCAEVKHPFGCRKSERVAGCLAKGFHKCVVGDNAWGRAIVDSFDGFVFIGEGHHIGNVLDVDPTHFLMAGALVATEAEFGQVAVWDHDAAFAQCDGYSEDDFAGFGELDVVERLFPALAYFNGEAGAYVASEFVLGAVFCVSVDGGRGGVDPYFGWAVDCFDGFAEDGGGVGPAFENSLFVFGGIAAVDGFAGEVDEQVGIIEFHGPAVEGAAIPVGIADIVVGKG